MQFFETFQQVFKNRYSKLGSKETETQCLRFDERILKGGSELPDARLSLSSLYQITPRRRVVCNTTPLAFQALLRRDFAVPIER